MKYTLNENYFENIDCADKAYWLGFIAADGSISPLQPKKRNQRLAIVIKAEDRYLLERFKKDINYTGSLHNIVLKSGKWKGNEYVQIQFTSNKIAQDLAKYNIVPRKTYSFTYPKNLPEEYTFDFIRGYFDGDGSVFMSQEKHWRHGTIVSVIHFRFVGTEDLLRVIQEKLNMGGSLRKKKNSFVYELHYKRRKKAKEFFEKLYTNRTLYLTRKYNVFKDVQRL